MLARLNVVKTQPLLGLAEATTTYDNALKFEIKAATRFVERLCDRQLVRATITDERYSGENEQELELREWPVSSITSISIWDSSTETWDAVTSTHYEVIDQRRVLYPTFGKESDAEYGSWPKGREYNIKATYVAGYDTTNWDNEDTGGVEDDFGVPTDLELAVAKLAVLQWFEGRGSKEGRLGKSGIDMGEQNLVIQRFQRGVPPEIMILLEQYRRPRI